MSIITRERQNDVLTAHIELMLTFERLIREFKMTKDEAAWCARQLCHAYNKPNAQRKCWTHGAAPEAREDEQGE